MKEIKIDRAGESYFEIRHPSGLPIFVYPKPQSHTAYAVFGTNYGSIDNTFRRSDKAQPTRVPNGIAHYLEHKMFENGDGVDTFARYAKTGANANAYTAFDKTCYLFSCTDHVYESLEILLDFVQKPYFTKETVQKEQGIIGQEIRMYDDDPSWCVLFHMLTAMYHSHPVQLDIAGSVESIAQITPELLYECYHTFYNLNNMALCVVGNVEPDRILELCNRMLKPADDVQVQRIFDPEPQTVRQHRVCSKGSVAVPQFCLGFKETASHRPTTAELVQTEILLEVVCGETSPLYRRLLDAELINESSFDSEYFEGPGYACVLFSGESKDPDAVAAEIQKEFAAVRENGLDTEAFATAKKSVYGHSISAFNSVENLANGILSEYFAGRSYAEELDALAAVTNEQVQQRLQVQMLPEGSVLSVVEP